MGAQRSDPAFYPPTCFLQALCKAKGERALAVLATTLAQQAKDKGAAPAVPMGGVTSDDDAGESKSSLTAPSCDAPWRYLDLASAVRIAQRTTLETLACVTGVSEMRGWCGR